jgi:hypothetical protein
MVSGVRCQVSGRGGAKCCWDVVVVLLVLVLDPFGNGLHQLYFFDYENEDDDEDEKLSTGHFRHSPLMSLHSNCPAGATFSERSLGKSIES